MFKQKKGFTLIELMLAISLFAALSVVSFVALNPAKHFGEAHDAQRWEDIMAITKAVELYQLDNDALPDDLASAAIGPNHKVVLCSLAAKLTCDGQERDCLVIDDSSFLEKYVDNLPIDPKKDTDTDTGYYITRTGDGMMTFGACNSYDEEKPITKVTKASLAIYTTTCGDGEVEGDEICDDGNLFVEGCGNATIETAGDYCNVDCSAVITISSDEACDSDLTTSCYDSPSGKTYYAGSYVSGEGACGTESICTGTCDLCTSACLAAPEYCGDGICNNGEVKMTCPGDCGGVAAPSGF